MLAEVERNAGLRYQLLLEVAQAGGSLDLASYRRSHLLDDATYQRYLAEVRHRHGPKNEVPRAAQRRGL